MDPSTFVLASNMKEELETVTLREFKNSIKDFNLWFIQKRKQIMAEKGCSKYGECLRNLFRTYLTGTNDEFITGIKQERRD